MHSKNASQDDSWDPCCTQPLYTTRSTSCKSIKQSIAFVATTSEAGRSSLSTDSDSASPSTTVLKAFTSTSAISGGTAVRESVSARQAGIPTNPCVNNNYPYGSHIIDGR